jgi:hypothetical protein
MAEDLTGRVFGRRKVITKLRAAALYIEEFNNVQF